MEMKALITSKLSGYILLSIEENTGRTEMIDIPFYAQRSTQEQQTAGWWLVSSNSAFSWFYVFIPHIT
jgi:hypothetical protein